MKIDYQRIENELIFCSESIRNPALFRALNWDFVEKTVSRPSPFPVIPKYNYEKVRQRFSFSSLSTRAEVIDALGRVRHECNKVLELSMFNTTPSKPLRMEEFEQSQLSTCTSTTLYLEDPWVKACQVSFLKYKYIEK